MRKSPIKSNCWYKLKGRYYFVKNETPEGIVFSSKENPSCTWIRTGKEAWYFRNNARKVSIKEVEENISFYDGSNEVMKWT